MSLAYPWKNFKRREEQNHDPERINYDSCYFWPSNPCGHSLAKIYFQKIKNKAGKSTSSAVHGKICTADGVLCFFGWKFRTREIVRNFSEKSDCNLESSRL